MTAAFALPRLLDRLDDRRLMLLAAAALPTLLSLGTLVPGFFVLLPLWFALGFAYSLTQTPSGRLLRRSAHAEDRPALFAAQFALSHACWLITYPAAGWLGAKLGLPATFAVMAAIAAFALVLAIGVWPAGESRRDRA